MDESTEPSHSSMPAPPPARGDFRADAKRLLDQISAWHALVSNHALANEDDIRALAKLAIGYVSSMNVWT